MVSGGNINNHKSQIYVWNIKDKCLLGISQILGFHVSNEWKSFKYLKFSTCLKTFPREYWHVIIQKLKIIQKFREKMEP
jgi:hypothetical protein